MINENQIIAMADKAKDSLVLIVHVRTARSYLIVGHSKSKIDGVWTNMISYATKGITYSRLPSDFSGFAPSIS